MPEHHSSHLGTFSRRGFLGVAGSAALAATLAACSAGSGGSTLKFWDMQWGTDARYNTMSKKITTAFSKSGVDGAYQSVSWSNFNQVFSSAIASKTGPAVSTGGGFQSLQFAKQGAIAYADDLIATMRENGTFDDFVPGTVEPFKTANGYAALPWNLDVVVLWYRKSILDEVGVAVPTSWDEYLTAAEQLAKKGYYAYGTGAGSDNSFGPESMLIYMINNGGGLFDDGGELDVTNDRNIEAMQFVTELVKAGAVDPASTTYSNSNMLAKWKSKQFAMGWYDGFLDSTLDATGDVLVGEPLTSPRGTKNTIQYINNVMMYTNTPSQDASEEFVQYWLKNLVKLWDAKLVPEMPALQSIVKSSSFQADAQAVKISETWQPLAKTLAARSTKLTATLASIDGSQAMIDFTQKMLGGGDGKQALTQLQADIRSAAKA